MKVAAVSQQSLALELYDYDPYLATTPTLVATGTNVIPFTLRSRGYALKVTPTVAPGACGSTYDLEFAPQ
jgi:hypothetical protein